MKLSPCLIGAAVIAAAFGCGSGCATSELVDVWSDPAYHGPPLANVLVISLGKTPIQRRIWEDGMSAALQRHAVTATPSYRLFPDAVPDTAQVVQVVGEKKYDGVFVTRRLPTETTTQYIQGYAMQEQTLRYDYRRERFMRYYRDVAHDGYIDSQKVDIRAIDVWSTANDGTMLWGALSKSPEPNSTDAVRTDVIHLVMADLTQRRIVGPER